MLTFLLQMFIEILTEFFTGKKNIPIRSKKL